MVDKTFPAELWPKFMGFRSIDGTDVHTVYKCLDLSIIECPSCSSHLLVGPYTHQTR